MIQCAEVMQTFVGLCFYRIDDCRVTVAKNVRPGAAAVVDITNARRLTARANLRRVG